MKSGRRKLYGDVQSVTHLLPSGGSDVELVPKRARLRMVMARSRKTIGTHPDDDGDGTSVSFTNGESGDTGYELAAWNAGGILLDSINYKNTVVNIGEHGILFDDSIWVSSAPTTVCFDYLTIFYS